MHEIHCPDPSAHGLRSPLDEIEEVLTEEMGVARARWVREVLVKRFGGRLIYVPRFDQGKEPLCTK